MKLRLSLCLLFLIAVLCHVRTDARIVVLDDINGDGLVDVTDVNLAIDAMLAGIQGRQVDDVIAAVLTGCPDTIRTGHDLIWNYGALPEVHLTVSLDEWNRLLALYDADRLTTSYVHARVLFITGCDTLAVEDAGLRIRGNGSRRRPEGAAGQVHEAGKTVWHPTGWGINLRKYHKNDTHTLQGVRKLWLRYFYHDPAYVRELYCYRLFEQYGVWTTPRDTYCRVWVGVEGDAQEAYYGVYSLLEPIDDDYLDQRREQFGPDIGYLWKAGQGIANLKSTADWLFTADNDDATATEYAYQLKTRTGELDNAKAQLKHFITRLNTLDNEEFEEWIEGVCDVEMLLRTYAVMVAVANWDDYWNNGNNYYLYFNSTQVTGGYQVFFIPYDLDNTLGSSRHVGAITDAARQDPLHWGQDEKNPLIARIINIPAYKKYYVRCLRELTSETSGLFHHTGSMERIAQWQQWIAPYVPNDTDKDNVLKDEPSKLGNTPQYRLLDPDPEVNFFKVREQVIKQTVE